MIKHCLQKGLMAVLAVFAFQTAGAQGKPVGQPAAGNDVYAGTAVQRVAPAKAEQDWKSLGKGLYRDDFVTTLYLVDNFEFEVDVEESVSTPGLYRLVTPYKNYPMSPAPATPVTYMEVNATDPVNVYFRRYDTGMDWGQGHIIINSIAGDYYDKGKFQQAVADGLCGVLEDGVITFPLSNLLVADGTVPQSDVPIYRIANQSGMFRLKLPGAPDLDVVPVIKDKFEKDGKTFIPVDFQLGKDVEKIKVAMFEGEYNDALADAMIGGSAESSEMTASGEYLFPCEKDGLYTFVAVPYYKGVPKKPVHVTQEFNYFETDWEDVGTAQYTDGFLADNEVDMNLDVETTEVRLQESTKKRGLFRLVDPYGLNYKYSNTQNYDVTRRYYMEIDASDPRRVVIHKMEDGCGLVFSGLSSRMQLWSRADRGLKDGVYTQEQIESSYGKYVGKEITFPRNALLIKFVDVKDTWYWANKKGSFKLVLPYEAGIDAPIVDNTATSTVEYYTLTGVKVLGDPQTPGIYIKRQGSKSSKVIMR